jgi:hypothetical protein
MSRGDLQSMTDRAGARPVLAPGAWLRCGVLPAGAALDGRRPDMVFRIAQVFQVPLDEVFQYPAG